MMKKACSCDCKDCKNQSSKAKRGIGKDSNISKQEWQILIDNETGERYISISDLQAHFCNELSSCSELPFIKDYIEIILQKIGKWNKQGKSYIIDRVERNN